MKTFRDAMRQKDLVVSAKMQLDRQMDASSINESVGALRPVVDAMQFEDDRSATGHMSPLAAAGIAIRSDLDAVVEFSCRDRNRLALQADMLGAGALGVTSLVLARGEQFRDRDAVRAKGVFEINATQLIRMAGELGPVDESGSGFYIGAPATVFDPAESWEATRLEEKLDAGVCFLQTQPCLNVDLVRRYVEKLVERKIMHRASLIVEVPLLTSPQEAVELRDVHKGAPIPDALVKRIASADDSVAEGISVCAEVLAELREAPGISGVCIRFQCDPRHVLAAIEQAGLVRRG